MKKAALKKRPTRRTTNSRPPRGKTEEPIWEMRLYIAGQTPNSMVAVANLKKLCEEQLQGRYRIELIDLIQRPQLAKGDQIVAIPTLVRKIPEPMKRMIGNLSQAGKFLVGLDLKACECNQQPEGSRRDRPDSERGLLDAESERTFGRAGGGVRTRS